MAPKSTDIWKGAAVGSFLLIAFIAGGFMESRCHIFSSGKPTSDSTSPDDPDLRTQVKNMQTIQRGDEEQLIDLGKEVRSLRLNLNELRGEWNAHLGRRPTPIGAPVTVPQKQ